MVLILLLHSHNGHGYDDYDGIRCNECYHRQLTLGDTPCSFRADADHQVFICKLKYNTTHYA